MGTVGCGHVKASEGWTNGVGFAACFAFPTDVEVAYVNMATFVGVMDTGCHVPVPFVGAAVGNASLACVCATHCCVRCSSVAIKDRAMNFDGEFREWSAVMRMALHLSDVVTSDCSSADGPERVVC